MAHLLPAKELRKTPRQERSRAMVERIIAAGQTVLLRDGYEKASTNRVADEAGISPGSLYQYFPDKEAILAAVIDRYAAEFSTQLTAVLADRLDEPGPALVRASFEGLLDVLTENIEFLRLVVEVLPRSQSGSWAGALEQRISDLVTAYLSINKSQTSITDPAASAWILVRMVEHLSVQYVLEQPPISRTKLIDEMVDLTLAYLGPTS
ncbi:AcrR family transcriptional regulator [Aeromicrobium panaciterrae]|uniref:AcrR family transcriptional regulator n=1 Tax=Aeromicrobium panaciterrae TaxID=363861 RepID=A0ABU1UP37_9ACTN|nr:TetR/AcrR family transcriptional regulator [Aeromicrobium panaciterrae]MDR7086908.1 AcrR family transcriptional regulator [Aeromicrobium panaciterrae]